MGIFDLPPAQASPIEHADWLEAAAMMSTDGIVSFDDFVAQIRISGSTEALSDPEQADFADSGQEESQSVATDAWLELDWRRTSCGDEGAYPFELTEVTLQVKQDWRSAPYTFLLLLSHFQHDAGPNTVRGDRLFERLSALAGQAYFGPTAKVVQFGFPRPNKTGFVKALGELCRQLGEGTVRTDSPHIAKQKDAHLDVVVWRPFYDGRRGQLIGFGQCATGAGWKRGKLAELTPTIFRERWLADDGFYPEPVRMFYLPYRVSRTDWRDMAIEGGIILERCRIAQLVGEPSPDVASDCESWSMFVLKKVGRKRGNT